jgi:hypothetical protein
MIKQALLIVLLEYLPLSDSSKVEAGQKIETTKRAISSTYIAVNLKHFKSRVLVLQCSTVIIISIDLLATNLANFKNGLKS